MRKLTLKNKTYKALEEGYKNWLKRLGYSQTTVYSFPGQVREYLHWLELNGQSEINKINRVTAEAFMTYFKDRPNQNGGGSVSSAHTNKQIYCLNLLFKYLRLTDQMKEKIKLVYEEKSNSKTRIILSEKEVKTLYMMCGTDALGQRDRAMLGVYYGCGLRRTEGLKLEVEDVIFDKRLLYVRQSKNGWSRYVPMVSSVQIDLECYINNGRKILMNGRSPSNLFLSERGTQLNPSSMLLRLKDLLMQAGLPREVCLHSLRHSIGTHLRNQGMKLEQISLFLGHKSLDSSQIYTHLKLPKWKKN